MGRRFRSLEAMGTAAQATATRFPTVLLFGAVAAGAGIWTIELEETYSFAFRLLFTAALGLPLFTALRLLAERRRVGRGRAALLDLLGAIALLGFLLASARWSETVALTRWFELAVAFHLFVAVLPYAKLRESTGFWQYNRALFVGFLTAVLYSLVIYAGLSIALLAVDNLLGIDVAEITYGRLWFLVAFVFNTWFFLSGIPGDLEALDEWTDYPIGLKVFAQFVLVPLVSVYLLILTVYLGKVVVTRVWPSGWIGYLVSSVAVLGILALLLVHPVRDRKENVWIQTYARWFFGALLPSIVMLLMAIWQRIAQYGVTERRYFLVVLALWLAGVALYYTITGSRRIKPIPVTLALISLLTFFGPWSAYSLSRTSQTGRLEELLIRNELLVDGTVRAAERPAALSTEDRREISAVLRYLIETHGTRSIEPWFDLPMARIDTIGTSNPEGRRDVDARARLIVAHLEVDYLPPSSLPEAGRFSYLADQPAVAIPIADFDHAYQAGDLRADRFRLDGRELWFESSEDGRLITLGDSIGPRVEIPVAELVERLDRRGVGQGTEAPRDAMRLDAGNERLRVRLYVQNVSGERTDEGPTVVSATGWLLLDWIEETDDDGS